MDLALLALTLSQRRLLGRSEALSPRELTQLSHKRLQRLLTYATERSAFYGERLSLRSGSPLQSLPTLSRSDLVVNFDRILTDPSLSAGAVRAQVDLLRERKAATGSAWRGRWWLAATAGTTGEPAALVWSRAEWATVLASYSRATRWAGVEIGPRSPLRVALVSTSVPTHQSAVVGASLRAPFVSSLTLDARSPLETLVEQLHGFGPRVLVGYASALRQLALAQLDGRLRIRPEAVMSASEVLTAPTAVLLKQAWGRPAFDVYAATETAGIAAMCTHGSRHLYSDLVVVEPVDADGTPTPSGQLSHHTLVSVLFSRTLPLIRYEISDRIRLLDELCECGLPFPCIGEIGGRAENTLLLPRRGRQPITLNVDELGPVVEAFPVMAWQAAVQGNAVVLVVAGLRDLDEEALTEALRRHLARTGVVATVSLRRVDGIPRTRLGKSIQQTSPDPAILPEP